MSPEGAKRAKVSDVLYQTTVSLNNVYFCVILKFFTASADNILKT
jgi:hypothetical protein